MSINSRKPNLVRALLAALVLSLTGLVPLSALDVADGRIRLTLHEGIGRFSISCQTKGSTGTFVPFLAAQALAPAL